MKKSIINIILALLSTCLAHFFISCNEEVCKLPNGKTTSDLLARVAREQNYNYCGLLGAALDNNIDSIRKLALLQFSDAVGYDHGAVLIEVISKVGENNYVNALYGISRKEKELVDSYLSVGLKYGYRKEYENRKLKEVFPSIDAFLNSH